MTVWKPQRFLALLLLGVLALVLVLGCGRGPEDVGGTGPSGDDRVATTEDEPETPSAETADPAAEVSAVDEAVEPAVAGDSVMLISEVVSTEGGTIRIEDPASPLAGLVITVPENAYAEATQFAVSSRLFTGELSEDVSVLSPVIHVENGGEYASDVMTVAIPIELPDEHFAMGFFLHDDGSLEGMPLVELTDESITVATMHFSEFLIAAIANTVLEESVDTGYRPGQDDWQFPNYGSAISPGGNCAGMSISAMWYYTERHLNGAPQLHGRFDNASGDQKTPDLWQDDSLGYRLVSSIQEDMDWGSNTIQPLFKTLGAASDEATWKCFLFSMQLTGEPQFVYIRSTDGGAHAMVAYAADAERKQLTIADPNYREQSRYISIENGAFIPYMSARSFTEALAGRFKSYDIIRYAAKSSVVPWPTVARRWKELEGGSIGSHRFPMYLLMLRSAGSETIDLLDGMETGREFLTLDMEAVSGMDCTVFRANRVLVESTGTHMIPLTPGENLLGFLVHRDVVEDGETHEDKYVDFRWVRINRTSTTYQIELDVQVNATIERVNVPDPSSEYEGEKRIHDTPFEKLSIIAYAPGELTGDVYSARWNEQPDPDPEIDGVHSGYVEIVIQEGDEGISVFSFSGYDELKYTDGTVRISDARGNRIPTAETEDGTLQFMLVGQPVGESLYDFQHDWAFGSGDTRRVLDWRADEYTVIRITIR